MFPCSQAIGKRTKKAYVSELCLLFSRHKEKLLKSLTKLIRLAKAIVSDYDDREKLSKLLTKHIRLTTAIVFIYKLGLTSIWLKVSTGAPVTTNETTVTKNSFLISPWSRGCGGAKFQCLRALGAKKYRLISQRTREFFWGTYIFT